MQWHSTNGNKIGAAETGGAILAIRDAKEGAYTNNSDGSITGPSGGRLTSTGKRDDSGNEIYRRDSGGYYVIDDNGVQRTTSSPNEHGNTLGDQPAELYCLTCRRTGEPLKYGETTHGEDRYGAGNQKRYSTDEIEEMGVEYEKIDSGTKIDMHRKQTEMIKQYEQENGKKPDLNKTYQ